MQAENLSKAILQMCAWTVQLLTAYFASIICVYSIPPVLYELDFPYICCIFVSLTLYNLDGIV